MKMHSFLRKILWKKKSRNLVKYLITATEKTIFFYKKSRPGNESSYENALNLRIRIRIKMVRIPDTALSPAGTVMQCIING